jgi:tetrapyrrole methylase family protein/MazG family protein
VENTVTDEFRKLVGIMARLRAEGGCEWDRAQTHDTLRQYLVEETHEVIDAIRGGNPDSLCEELGDLLLQILFHAQIASENGQFDIADVIASISEKMVRRHPHVFGDATADTPEAVSRQWDHIKKTIENRSVESIIGGIPKDFPSLLRAAITEGDPAHLEHELGDVLFSLVNLARFLGLNAEVAMVSVNERFERRFREMEKIASETGCSIENADMAALDRLWELAKQRTG